MPECDNCGEFVSCDYYRVFSTPDGELLACPECGHRTNVMRHIKENR